jgi:sugar phosphate isomerase/epimerase
VHDRISVNNLCFPGASLATDIERLAFARGASASGSRPAKMSAEGWDAYLETLRGAGFAVETIVHLNARRFDDDAEVESFSVDLSRTLAAAEVLARAPVYTTTGARGTLTWEETAERFCAAIAPCAEQARRAGVELLVEPAPTLYPEFYFTHTLRDAVQLASRPASAS